MEIKREHLEAIEIVTPQGALCTNNDVSVIMDEINSMNDINLIIDLGEVSVISTSNINFLSLCLATCNTFDKSFVICCVNKSVLETINTVFDEDDFIIVPTKNEAVDLVYMEEQERQLFN
jgi:anti-anti-sigma regulatory factor